ncbi:hypothetical protein ACFYPT_39110 [Streptomyces sp. NPDC005529]|uniref:hypothetical protein n=1 Tax=unclassified Streptomyces TaxID=2593676 RepID=UPI0033B210D5
MISRTEVIQRAMQWVVERVPYSQTSWWTDTLGTYRQDCSGYVSMAWGLDQTANYWTGNLNTVAHPVQASELQPGDILLSSSHTLIFAGWDDTSGQHFSFYEEPRPGLTAHYVRNGSYPQYAANGFISYRYNSIDDRTAPGPAQADAWLTSALKDLPLPVPSLPVQLQEQPGAAASTAPSMGEVSWTLTPTGWSVAPAGAASPEQPSASPHQPASAFTALAVLALVYLAVVLRTLGRGTLTPPYTPKDLSTTTPHRPEPPEDAPRDTTPADDSISSPAPRRGH